MAITWGLFTTVSELLSSVHWVLWTQQHEGQELLDVSLLQMQRPSLGICELTWGCFLFYSPVWRTFKSYLLLQTKASFSSYLKPWSPVCMWTPLYYCLVSYILCFSVFSVTSNGLLPCIQGTLEGAPSVITLEYCDQSLELAVWLRWCWTYTQLPCSDGEDKDPVDVLGHFDEQG